ncbi:hypothetical protein [Tunicatimonas pelagia]|uniref:hypothetical protein n=1 Tax=Tunicatimonas pelagia TaxID=931531 RepID=UPI0026669787|nr:hypothetical protein [Tunicatimonas pelagia]WKN44441.1 hypothetical protein P0M28_05620 [Tunicatimonas pelagia]
MSCKIVATQRFEKDLKRLFKKYPSLPSDLRDLREELQSHPKSGTSLGRKCYKVRLAIKSKGKGKSGGARVITYLVEESKELTLLSLLSIYDKSEVSSLTDKELTELIAQVRNS